MSDSFLQPNISEIKVRHYKNEKKAFSSKIGLKLADLSQTKMFRNTIIVKEGV